MKINFFLLYLIPFILVGCSLNNSSEKRAEEWYKALQIKDFKKAYSYLHSDCQKEISLQNYLDFWQRKSNIQSIKDFKIEKSYEIGKWHCYKLKKIYKNVRVIPVQLILRMKGGQEVEIELLIHSLKENGEWKFFVSH